MNDYKFGNFVCLLREKKGMTQAELGTLLGVTAAAVSKWENGSSKPRTDVLFRLAEILEVTPEELIAGEYINSKLEDSEAVKQINERYKYLKKVDLFNNGKIKARRIVAWMIDWILVGTIVIFASGIYAAAVKNIGITKNALAAIGMVFMILMLPIGFILREVIVGGRSVGKRIMGLMIIDRHTGSEAKASKKIFRNITFFLMYMDGIVLLSSGLTIGDRAAHTAVVSKKEFDAVDSVVTAEERLKKINDYVAPKNKTVKRTVIIVACVIVGIALFAILLSNIIDTRREALMETDEYKLAYAYLADSDSFKALNVSEDHIRFVGHSVNSYNDENGHRKTDSEFHFLVRHQEDFTVVCHRFNNEWSVCRECTDFD